VAENIAEKIKASNLGEEIPDAVIERCKQEMLTFVHSL